MEPEASRAAVAAIAALQQRVRDLEIQSDRLEDERSELTREMQTRLTTRAIREKAMDDATDRARQMLSSASTALIQIREARAETAHLKKQIEEMERLIQTQGAKAKRSAARYRGSKQGISGLWQKLAEYEQLLNDVLVPPPQAAHLSVEEIALISTCENDPEILPPVLAKALAALQERPKEFGTQTIVEKRRTVQALTTAKATVADLTARIKNLQYQKFASSEPRKFEAEIRRLATHRLILSNEMQKFTFVRE